MNKCLKYLIFLIVISSSSLAQVNDSTKWNGEVFRLPFPANWAIQKPRKDPHDPLTFMDVNAPSPRVIANLTQRSFDLLLKDFSDFKSELINSKKGWVKKNKGKVTENPVVTFNGKTKLLRYEYTFSLSHGSFKEFGHFQKCRGNSFSLRVMIPEKQFKEPNAEVKKIIKFFRESSACI